MSKVTLDDLTVAPSSTIEDMVAKVRNYGAAVIPAWCDKTQIEDLKREFFEALGDTNPAYAYKINYPAGDAVSLMRAGLPDGRYSMIRDVFSNGTMEKVAKHYMGVNGLFNYEIYATHEYNPLVDVAPTHHDKLWSLKFMLYLNDVKKENAPFGVIPRSACYARENFRKIFEKNRLRRLSMSSPLYHSMSNSDVPIDLGPVLDIIGLAGTLIIFDSDTFHHAGVVTPGNERMILRGHSGPAITYTSVRKKSRQWWRGEKSFTRFDDWLNQTMDGAESIFSSVIQKIKIT